MKVVLVHDYLNEYGGAERVLLALHEVWPEAPIYTIFCKKNSSAGRVFGPSFAPPNRQASEGKIVQSWFGKIPFCEKLISPFRFLIPLIWGSFNFSKYDLVISSASWAITKGFAGGKTKEVCYCHTPPRYLYGYETSRNWKKHWWIKAYAAIVNHFMRMYDFSRAQKVTYFIANSREVAGRIKKFYRREATVINPPVDLPRVDGQEGQEESGGQEKYYLTGGRLEAAKNFDLIIKACNELGVRLKVYGTGSQENYLKSIARLASLRESKSRQAGPTIEFLGKVSDEEKFNLMAGCKAFIVMAKDEDFGITPVEAMAVGTPVIAYKGGGYLETVVGDPPSSRQSAGLRTGKGKTGVFVKEATVEGIIKGIRDFKDVRGEIKPKDCRKQAEKFSKERFKKEISDFVEKVLTKNEN